MNGSNDDNENYPVDPEEDLFSIYCELYETARERLLSGANIHLDEIAECIDNIENFGKIVDEDEIKKHPLIAPHYKKTIKTISAIRESYHHHFSNEKIEGATLKKMMNDIRELVGNMQRNIGKIQSITEGLKDINERIELREFIRKLTDLKKLIKHFNDSFSKVKRIEWNAGYSKTHIHISPLGVSIYRPIKSKLMEIGIRGDTEIDITVGRDNITAEISGKLYFNFFAFGKMPNINVEKLIIDGKEGVEIFGDGKQVLIKTEYGETKVHVMQ